MDKAINIIAGTYQKMISPERFLIVVMRFAWICRKYELYWKKILKSKQTVDGVLPIMG